MNHANLPTIATAPLPQTYQAAQTALKDTISGCTVHIREIEEYMESSALAA